MKLSASPVLCLVLFSASGVHAQADVRDDAGQHASASRIDLLVERLDQLAREHHVAGMGLAVVTPDGVFTRGIGLADLANDRPVTADTLFEIGSVTKGYTAVLLARLAAEGKLDFDDHVREHVPYFHLKNPEADEKVSLRDLLCHRTGVTRTDSLLNGTEELTVEEIVRQLALAEPMAPFRQQFLYNNHMFLVAGLASEHAGGTTYAELLDDKIFGPLEMNSSTAVLSDVLADERMSSGYRWLTVEEDYEQLPTRGIERCAPAGAIISSPADMARYVSFLLARGAKVDGERILSPAAFDDDLWKVQAGSGSGLGFGVASWRGRTMIHHDGGLDGFTSVLALLPEEGIGLALLTNAAFSGAPHLSIDITFATLLGEEVQEVVEEDEPFTAEELQAFTGDFDFAGMNAVWIVFVNEAGRLALDYPDQTVYELAWMEDVERWAFALAPNVQLAFHRDAQGVVDAMTVHNGDIEIPMPRKSSAGLPSVDDVFELTDKAMPPVTIEAARPLRVVGAVELVHEGLSGRFELLYQDDEHWRHERDFGKFGRTTTVIDGDSGWSSSATGGVQDMSDAEYAGARRDAPLATLSATRALYRSVRVLDVVGKDEDERILLRMVPLQGPPVTLRIDGEGCVRRANVAVSLGDMLMVPIETVYADIREFDGIRLAHRVEVSNPFVGMTRMVTEKIERNIELPAAAWAK